MTKPLPHNVQVALDSAIDDAKRRHQTTVGATPIDWGQIIAIMIPILEALIASGVLTPLPPNPVPPVPASS